MTALDRLEQRADCPYCGEPLTLLIDESDDGMEYVEDCHVCCRPMVVTLWMDDEGLLTAALRRDDE